MPFFHLWCFFSPETWKNADRLFAGKEQMGLKKADVRLKRLYFQAFLSFVY